MQPSTPDSSTTSPSEITETVTPATAADPVVQDTYTGEHHHLRRQGLTWGLQEIGWVGPEVVTIAEQDLIAVRDLLSRVISDLGL